MRGFNSLVLEEQRHLKWRGLDWLEQVLMILCGIAITGFSILVMCDIVTRTIGHPWLVVLGVALCMVYFGYLNFLDGFKSLRMPSMTPLSSLYAAIPLCGALVALFIVEQMANGWKNGFAGTSDADEKRKSL